MAKQLTLSAQTRQTKGKGAARSLRRTGQVPAVIYGHGRQAEPLALDDLMLQKVLMTAHGSTLLDVAIDGRAPVKALLREVQRDALKPTTVLHVDLFEVRADEKITVQVAVHLTGTADGVRNGGGVLDHTLRELTIKVLPANIPEHIEVDVTPLMIGHAVHVRDIKLPNVEILNAEGLTVCVVVPPRTEEVVAPVGEPVVAAEPELIRKAKAEGEEGEGTEAAAPAAGAKPKG
ncbi:MAG TPA: 50S ribosomal protein L25 [Gemmatimonadales bacterium]|nr:50S ribosomal protein L25 [Gemmatimonadales bacterium]